MKTFRTVGSGSTQTIEPIENNKIPVYETKTAAETDLANLEVGQIVATKDEGNENAKPVDVVESGNMHAVTSNAVADAISYSTDEVKTGGKWIDGKPIYRKVIVQDVSSLSGLVSISLDIANIDKPIRIALGNVSLPNGNNYLTIPAQYDSNTFVQLGPFNANEVKLYCGTTNWNTLTHVTLCLEYTKTTD